jgi:UDP-glucuronate decarboxylase
MKILVTGGVGFLGANLCRFLLDKGHEVVCMDNLLPGNIESVRDLMKNPKFKFMNWDITEPINMKVDQIYNLACPASPPHYQKHAEHTIKTCTIGIMNMLDLADKNNARLLQTSTSEVYGDPLEHPQKETYFGNVNPIGPRACYDEGKRIAEAWMLERNKAKGTQIRIARLFNVYGPYMDVDDKRVVSEFVLAALKNKPIPVFGDGEQTRSFCFVQDMCEALYTLMNQDEFIGPVNLGNPHEITMKQLAESIIKLSGSKSELKHLPLPVDDPKVRCPDITLAKAKLNWEPKIALDEGLKTTIEFYRELTKNN